MKNPLVFMDSKYVELTPNHLKIDEKTPYEVWISIGKSLKTMSKSVNFWVGDWIIFGERRYGEKYKEAMEITGLSYQGLADITYTCANIEISSRNENLPFAHHKAVAKLSPKEQEKWLKKAEEEKMPVSKLRNLIAGRQPSEKRKLTICPKCGHEF